MRVSDLVPISSGKYSIGDDILSSAINSIKPFKSVNQIQANWQDPILGSSGVIQYRGRDKQLELSHDGGRNFSPIISSGNMIESLRMNLPPLASGIHVIGAAGDEVSTINFPPSAKVVVPYAQINQLSGIFFDPRFGSQGIFRWNQNGAMFPGSGQFEMSFNNGTHFEPIVQFTQTTHARATVDTAVGAQQSLFNVSGSAGARGMVPSGMKMVVLAIEGQCEIPTTATLGSYTINFGIRTFLVNERLDFSGSLNKLTSVVSTPGLLHCYAQGTINKPLLRVDGGIGWMLYYENQTGNPGSLGTGDKNIIVTYKYIKDLNSGIVL